jgi:hypothetical protein
MKNIRILAVIVLAVSLVSPSTAHAAGIPLSHCESVTGNLPPANDSTNWAANGVCNDLIDSVGGRTFFFQENRTAENPKDHSYIYWTELYVQDASKNWVDLGKAPALVNGFGSNTNFTNFVETPQGLFLGGIFSAKDIGICGQGFCKTINQYETLKIDGSNHVSKFILPSLPGVDKSPGTPFASGTPNLIYFAQTQGSITTFGKPGIWTSSGQRVKKGTAVHFYSLDLTTNKLTALPQLTSIATELGLPPIASYANSILLFNPESTKIFQLFPSGKMSNLDWNTNEIYQQIKDGIVATVQNTNSIIFHMSNGQNQTCDYAGAKTGLPANSKDVSFEPESLKGSTSTNTVLIPFRLGSTTQQNYVRMNSDCSSSINDLGSDTSATKKFVDEITHQVKAQARKGEILRMFTPDGFVFDKVLAASYEADGATLAGFSGPRVVCTLDQSKVAKMVSDNFAGNNYVEWKVNPGSLGANCSYPGPQKFKIVNEALSISVHYVPNNDVVLPAPVAPQKSPVLQATGIGDAKWPAKCPAVTDTVGGVQPKISGFKFDGSGGENYMRLVDGGSTAVTSPANVLGCYADIPSLNGPQANAWHIGTINRDSSGFYWLNAAGVRWGLTLSGTILITDKNNPYYDKGHQFITY